MWQIKTLHLHYYKVVVAIKIGRVATYKKELPPKLLHNYLLISCCEATWKIKLCYISTSTRPTIIKNGKVVTCYEGFPPIKSHNSDKSNYNFTATTLPIWLPKLAGWWLTTSLIKLHDPLIMWSCKITWQIKNVFSPLPQCLKPPNLGTWWLRKRSFLQ